MIGIVLRAGQPWLQGMQQQTIHGYAPSHAQCLQLLSKLVVKQQVNTSSASMQRSSQPTLKQ